MSFCPACGRRRTDSSRFCGGCGHDFGEQAAAGGSAPPAVAVDPAPTAANAKAAVDNTRWDAPADATRLEPPTADTAAAKPAEPDPFAAWFAPQAPAAAADQWHADTVYAAPNQPAGYQPAGYPPPSQQGPVFPPPQGPVGGPPPRQPSRGVRAALIILAVLIVLGAGGAAYALFPKSIKSAAVTSPPAASSGATPTTQSSATSSGSPGTSPTVTATGSASPSPSLVRVAQGVGSNPATPQVETVLTHYFQGINTHSYAEYSSALDAQEQAKQPQSTFDSGYSTTTDSGMTLTSLTSTSGGGLAATVTFTSHQSASASVDKKSTCNHWTLTLYLVPQGTGYLKGAAPSGYQPTYSDC
jgi:hypothetical protein